MDQKVILDILGIGDNSKLVDDLKLSDRLTELSERQSIKNKKAAGVAEKPNLAKDVNLDAYKKSTQVPDPDTLGATIKNQKFNQGTVNANLVSKGNKILLKM